MAFKAEAKKKTIVGTFQSPLGEPSQGKVTLRLTEPVLGRDEGVVYTRETVQIALDANGGFSQDIVVTKRSLTDDEQADYEDLKEELQSAAEDLDDVQQEINDYLTAQHEGTVPTQQQAEQYRDNLAEKAQLSADIIQLTAQIKEIEAHKAKLESYKPVLNVKLDFDQKRQGRLNLNVYVAADGPGTVNLADLEIAY